jgi:hypothetical protein
MKSSGRARASSVNARAATAIVGQSPSVSAATSDRSASRLSPCVVLGCLGVGERRQCCDRHVREPRLWTHRGGGQRRYTAGCEDSSHSGITEGACIIRAPQAERQAAGGQLPQSYGRRRRRVGMAAQARDGSQRCGQKVHCRRRLNSQEHSQEHPQEHRELVLRALGTLSARLAPGD